MKKRSRVVSVKLVAAAVAAGLVSGCVTYPPLETVGEVDVERYAGKWYEIARYPNNFQQGCVGTTATYTLLDNGRIEVLNRCRQGALDGPVEEIRGTARVTDPETNAKLAVTFFFPFEGPYWIIQLGDDYAYAVVGEPSRSLLWVLSRTPTLPPDVFAAIEARLVEQGYDPERLMMTPQPEVGTGG
jgi:apolipoprotein D and lipocalin family protein